MAIGGTTFVKTKRIKGFTTILTSAACEWFLIFLLLVNAVLSYLLTKFASYCDLQAPCMLCSRLDNVLNGGKLELYQNLLCGNHRSEISSLISCHIHDKISDGHGMCDDCLLSFTPKNKHNPKTHRLLTGKLGLVLGGCGFPSSLLSRDLSPGSIGSKPCTCCGKVCNSGQNAQKSLQLNSSERAVFKPDIPLPHESRQSHLNHRDNLNKIRDESSGPVASPCLGKSGFDPLSYVWYSELKPISDSESEFAFSDEDDFGSIINENIDSRNNPIAQFTSVVPPKCLLSDSNPAKPNSISPETVPLLLYPCAEPNISKYHDVNFPGSGAVNNYGLGEINWQQADQNSSSSEFPELISLDKVSSSPNVVDISNGESEDSRKIACLSRNSLPAALSELMTSDTYPIVGASPKKSADETRASGIGFVPKKHEEGLEKITTRPGESIETEPHVNDSALLSPRHDNSSNMNEFPVTTKEREAPGFVIERPTPEEVNRVNEELKLSPSHNSSSGSNMSSVVPINNVNQPEIQTDTSSSNGVQVLQKSDSVESGLESLEGMSISDIEGESIVDRLKRQVEHDKKCLNSLYKELEEERNASAIAANQSMAMITRLQEEKAVLQMEALQYLRMMEEQAEYDVDALEKANDLLVEKEKEIQDLEAELEFYRSNLTDEPMGQNMHKESCDLNSKEENITVQTVSAPHIHITDISSNSKISELSEFSDESVAGETSLELEDEKLYISECLKNLEKKLRQISDDGISFNMPNGRPENFDESNSDQRGSSNGEGPQLEDQTEDKDLYIQKDFNTSNGSLTDQDGSVASKSDDCSPSKESNHSTSVGQKNSVRRKNIDLDALENEISDLNDRLEALEADQDLLEHILHSLRNENDGLQFIKGIAHQLHELRKIGTRQR